MAAAVRVAARRESPWQVTIWPTGRDGAEVALGLPLAPGRQMPRFDF